MIDGRQSAEWLRFQPVIYFLSEIRRLSCDPKRAPKPVKFEDCNPFAEKEKTIKVDLRDMRQFFTKKK